MNERLKATMITNVTACSVAKSLLGKRHNILAATPFLNPYLREFSYPRTLEMRDHILVTLFKMQPHYNQSSGENATPSSGTSPSASF